MSSGIQLVSAKLGGFNLLNPSPAYSEETQYKANSYYCPLGPESGVGYCLLAADKLAELYAQSGEFAEPVELELTAGDTVAFPLYVERAVACSGGRPGNNDRAYLLTLRDVRFLLAKFTDCNLQFNVRRPAPPTLDTSGLDPQEFYETTLNEGAPYSWQEAVDRIVEEVGPLCEGSFLLPFEPDGIPQNLQFVGVPAWQALHILLDKLDLTTAYDPTTGLFSIIDMGQPQEGLEAAELGHSFRLDDADPYSSFSLSIPAKFRVYFAKRHKHYGTEIDVVDTGNDPNDAFNQVYKVELPTGDPEAVPGTIKAVWDDLPAMVSTNSGGAPLFLNVGELEARAASRMTRWLARQRSSADRMRRIYQGIAAGFAPGSQVQAVQWYHFGDGWQTAVTRRPASEAPLDERMGRGGASSASGSPASESLEPPDYARRTLPNWPRNVQLIRVLDKQADKLGYYSAIVVRYDPESGSFNQVDECLAIESSRGATRRRETCAAYLGRLNGTGKNLAGEIFPLYLLDSGGGQILIAKADADIESKATGKVTIWDGPPGAEAATETKIDLYNSGSKLSKNDLVYLTDDCTGARLLNWPKPPILGKTKDGIKNKKSGTVIVYSVPEGGEQGDEEAVDPERSVEAFNKFFGYVTKDTWVLCQDDGDGYYIADTLQGDHLVARLAPPSSPGDSLEAHAAPTQVDVEIQPSDQAISWPSTPITVSAFARLFPPVDSERLVIVWTGSVFTIVSGEFDFLWAKLDLTEFTKGLTMNTVQVSFDGGNTFPMSLKAAVYNSLGTIPAGKTFTIRRVNTTTPSGSSVIAYSVVSAEC